MKKQKVKQIDFMWLFRRTGNTTLSCNYRKTELTQEEIDEGFDFIKTLNPKPAANYAQESTFLIPECKVSVEGENLQVELLKFDLSITVIDDDSLKKQRKEAETLLSALQKEIWHSYK